MQTRVAMWGGSCAVRLPKMAVETLGLGDGEPVTLTVEGDAIVIRAARKGYSLAELVAEAEGLQPPVSSDDTAMGKESL